MKASMKREFGCTSVTLLGGTFSSPGSRNSGASSISRSDIGAGNCGCASTCCSIGISGRSARERGRLRRTADVLGNATTSGTRKKARLVDPTRTSFDRCAVAAARNSAINAGSRVPPSSMARNPGPCVSWIVNWADARRR